MTSVRGPWSGDYGVLQQLTVLETKEATIIQ